MIISRKAKSLVYLLYIYLGKTSLIYAAERGYTNKVKILLGHGAEVNTQDKDG